MTEPTGQTVQIQAWIDRLRTGDELARKELLACACQRLERLTRKMLRDFPRVKRWEETADVTQNAALRLYRTLQDVIPRDVREFFRLASLNIRRELLDLAKHYGGPQGQGAHHATWQAGDDSRAGPGGRDPADESADPTQLARWSEFHERIETLPDEEREVFDLVWYQGLSQAEVAELLQVSERTIKRRWQSARLKLHELLQGESPDAG
jgi:RNA polymerase sigma-70 factor (ECF subfamily)